MSLPVPRLLGGRAVQLSVVVPEFPPFFLHFGGASSSPLWLCLNFFHFGGPSFPFPKQRHIAPIHTSGLNYRVGVLCLDTWEGTRGKSLKIEAFLRWDSRSCRSLRLRDAVEIIPILERSLESRLTPRMFPEQKLLLTERVNNL